MVTRRVQGGAALDWAFIVFGKSNWAWEEAHIIGSHLWNHTLKLMAAHTNSVSGLRSRDSTQVKYLKRWNRATDGETAPPLWEGGEHPSRLEPPFDGLAPAPWFIRW